MEFNNLVELHTSAFRMSSNKWIEFIMKNKQLEQLHLVNICIDNNGLSDITSADLSLHRIALEFCSNVDYESVVDFVQNNPKIRIFSIKKHCTLDSMRICHELGEKFEDQLSITDLRFELVVERGNKTNL